MVVGWQEKQGAPSVLSTAAFQRVILSARGFCEGILVGERIPAIALEVLSVPFFGSLGERSSSSDLSLVRCSLDSVQLKDMRGVSVQGRHHLQLCRIVVS